MIVVEDVHKRYQTDHGPGKWVLQGVSFTIPRNLSVGLIGANGAGKSTLLSLLLGFLHPQSGRVLVNGHDLATLDPAWQAVQRVARMFGIS